MLLRRRHVGEYAIAAAAVAGLWLFWSEYAQLATLSWWYDRAQFVESGGVLPNPTYDLGSLPWQSAKPRTLDRQPGALTLVTNDEPYAYQVFATVPTHGASAADIQFDIDVQSGGVTVGLLQAGKWMISSSSQRTGRFRDTNTTELSRRRSVTLVIANNNAGGESRLVVRALRLYLR